MSFWHPESNPPVGNLFLEVFLKKTFRPKISNSVSVFWDLPLSGTVSFWVPESSYPVGNLFFEVFLKKTFRHGRSTCCNVGKTTCLRDPSLFSYLIAKLESTSLRHLFCEEGKKKKKRERKRNGEKRQTKGNVRPRTKLARGFCVAWCWGGGHVKWCHEVAKPVRVGRFPLFSNRLQPKKSTKDVFVKKNVTTKKFWTTKNV